MNTSNDSTTVTMPVCATPNTTKMPSMLEADHGSIPNSQSAMCNGQDDSQPSTPNCANSDPAQNSELRTEQNDSQPSTPCPATAPINCPSALSSSPSPFQHPQLSTLNSQSVFPRSPGETPRAFGAFTAYFQLGQNRSLQAVADKLGEQLPTVKNWSSKYDWSERINHFNSGLLEQQAHAEAETARKAAADWAKRNAEYREQEWVAAQKLLGVVQCCLENFGERDLEKMRLSELSRALNVASKMSRSALQNPTAQDDKPAVAPIQVEMLAALKRIYGEPSAPSPSENNSNLSRSPNPTRAHTLN
ncbi:MAG: hypothetical protein JWO95_3699 [Verrucomicrobiales bacterium]|nr:hypothetical protein [Verrucomicrobiales bacterium]